MTGLLGYNYTLPRRFPVMESGVVLIKRSGMKSHAYDHYGVGICGSALKDLGFDPRCPVVFHKTNIGIIPDWADVSGDWEYAGSAASVDDAVARLRMKMSDHAYDLISKNCEHWARFIVEGTEQSTQVQTVVAFGSIGVALYLLSSRD